jgi:hypothetical protein
MRNLFLAIQLEHAYWYSNACKYQTRHGWAQAMFGRSSVYYPPTH